ncbi:MAG: OsmC family peroxiredoxin [Betaproteobacteria bacterium]|nr:OsmC family peroxiredoxin [Betaproteobacteria bacterium]
MAEKTITVELRQRSNYQFDIEFSEGMPQLMSDEPAPLGEGKGPSPVQMLAASVGNCLSDSLFFALAKFKQKPEPIHTTVNALVGRNAEGRMRVLNIEAKMHLGVEARKLEHLDRALEQFQEFCTVTQSVGQAIPIHIRVMDATGLILKD